MVSSRRLKPRPDVIHTNLQNGEAVLLHLEKAKYYTLNVTAARIWNLLSEDKPEQEIAQALAAEFDVDPARALRSVEALLRDLEAGGFVTGQPG
jgi:hypothetical protein